MPSKCKYLDGENVAPTCKDDVIKLLGKRVRYLQARDIDKSGRGYFFPREGKVEGSYQRNVNINGDYIPFKDIVDMEILENQ